MQPFSKSSEILTVPIGRHSSHKNFTMISQTVQELTYWLTNKHSDAHDWKQCTSLCYQCVSGNHCYVDIHTYIKLYQKWWQKQATKERWRYCCLYIFIVRMSWGTARARSVPSLSYIKCVITTINFINCQLIPIKIVDPALMKTNPKYFSFVNHDKHLASVTG